MASLENGKRSRSAALVVLLLAFLLPGPVGAGGNERKSQQVLDPMRPPRVEGPLIKKEKICFDYAVGELGRVKECGYYFQVNELDPINNYAVLWFQFVFYPKGKNTCLNGLVMNLLHESEQAVQAASPAQGQDLGQPEVIESKLDVKLPAGNDPLFEGPASVSARFTGFPGAFAEPRELQYGDPDNPSNNGLSSVRWVWNGEKTDRPVGMAIGLFLGWAEKDHILEGRPYWGTQALPQGEYC